MRVAPAAVDFMELNGAHQQDVSRLRAMFKSVCDQHWEAKESRSGKGMWYLNGIMGQKTREPPAQYYDPHWFDLTSEMVVWY